VGTVNLGWEDGKRQRKVFYGKTRTEVAGKLKTALHAQQQGTLKIDDRTKVEVFLDRWLREVVEPTTRPRTAESYRAVVTVHLKPALGHHPLSKLQPAHIQKMLADSIAKGLSNRTVEYQWQILRRALNVAVRWQLLARNVADLVTPPRPRHHEVTPLPLAEVRKILEVSRTHRLGAAYTLSVACGLRRGEVLALKWSDVDLDSRRLRVRSTLQRVGGKLSEGDPKSEKSRRQLALPTIAVEALRRRRASQAEERLAAGPDWHDTPGYVFTTPTGGPVDPRNLLRSWHQLLASLDIPPRPLHDPRHCAASLMLSEGVPLKVVQEVLGHSTMRLTADLYGHLMPGDEERAASVIDRALGL
jgi:integrase